MKKLIYIFTILLVLESGAQSKTRKAKVTKKSAQGTPAVPVTPKAAPARSAPMSDRNQKFLGEALQLMRNGQCEKAAPMLYSASKRGEFQAERIQIKYLLGSCLLDLKLYQVAAFQFVDVIRNGANRYTKNSIEKLSIAADALGDDTLLNYAISKVSLEDFPAQNRDMIYYRLGEIKLKNAKFGEATELFGKVNPSSRYAPQAKFNRGLAFLEGNHAGEALRVFKDLLSSRSGVVVTDQNRVAAEMAIARTYYQAQKWDEAVEAYRKIPRDTEFWHDSLFESSWALLRAAKFRSALSNFQSLHSTYYEDFYAPESLLLRSIVYLYICKYDEMDKVLTLFEKTYGPVRANITNFISSNTDPMAYFDEIDKAYSIRKEKKINKGLRIPYSVARATLDEGNVKRSLLYYKSLAAEKSRIDQIPGIARSSLGAYAQKVLANRARNTKIAVGEMVKNHLLYFRSELRDLYEQVGFIRYEMINGRKETLKKKIAGKTFDQVDESVDRNFYIQNGYEYWPFEGEYWLDEIGNYHYLGKQSCE